MNKKFLFAAATAACMSLSGIASAATATGTLSIAGASSFTSTSITFAAGAVHDVEGSTGDFTAVLPCSACVTMNIGTLDSTEVLPALIYTAVSGATSTFTLDAFTSFVYTPGVLDDLKITGTGTATLTGFDPTPAFWALTAQQPSGGGAPVFSFSATLISTVVPLPGALPLFATGLLGLVMLGRRRMKQKKLESAAA